MNDSFFATHPLSFKNPIATTIVVQRQLSLRNFKITYEYSCQ
jgi:hypothetical protein